MERSGPAISHGPSILTYGRLFFKKKKSTFLLISKRTQKMEKTSLCVVAFPLNFMHLAYAGFMSYAFVTGSMEREPSAFPCTDTCLADHTTMTVRSGGCPAGCTGHGEGETADMDLSLVACRDMRTLCFHLAQLLPGSR